MSLTNGYLLEPSREARILNRWRLIQSMPDHKVPEGHMQVMLPCAWLRDPVEPETRRVSYASTREVFDIAQVQFLGTAYTMANEGLRTVLHSGGSHMHHNTKQRDLDEQEALRSQESHEKEATEAKLLGADVKNNKIAALERRRGEGLRVKFWVFIKAQISEELLASFLKTIPEAPLGSASYEYVFYSQPTHPESEKEGKKEGIVPVSEEHSNNSTMSLEVPLAGVYTQLLDPAMLEDDNRAETSGDNMYTAEVQSTAAAEPTISEQVEVADKDEGYASSNYSDDDNASQYDSPSTSYNSTVVSPSATAKVCMQTPSPCLGMPPATIHETWQQLIAPYSSTCDFYGMHAYIVLDEQTAADWDTVLVVAETDGYTRERRVDFMALKEGIVLKGLESLSCDIHRLPGDWTGVVRGPVMDEARRLERWEREKHTRNGERYYAKNENIVMRDGDEDKVNGKVKQQDNIHLQVKRSSTFFRRRQSFTIEGRGHGGKSPPVRTKSKDEKEGTRGLSRSRKHKLFKTKTEESIQEEEQKDEKEAEMEEKQEKKANEPGVRVERQPEDEEEIKGEAMGKDKEEEQEEKKAKVEESQEKKKPKDEHKIKVEGKEEEEELRLTIVGSLRRTSTLLFSKNREGGTVQTAEAKETIKLKKTRSKKVNSPSQVKRTSTLFKRKSRDKPVKANKTKKKPEKVDDEKAEQKKKQELEEVDVKQPMISNENNDSKEHLESAPKLESDESGAKNQPRRTRTPRLFSWRRNKNANTAT